MNKARQRCEERTYKILNILDPTGDNANFYREKFAKMNDKEFINFFKQNFSIKYQMKVFTHEPKIQNIIKALKELKVPITERVAMPFMYKDKDGKVPYSKPALVVYTPAKRMKQMNVKKSSMSTNISMRDMKSGRLLQDDKNGSKSDKEFEALSVIGADSTMKELYGPRADSMEAKSEIYRTISLTGMVSEKDYNLKPEDSLARNQLNVWLLGAGLNSNLITEGDYLINTIKDKKQKTEREA